MNVCASSPSWREVQGGVLHSEWLQPFFFFYCSPYINIKKECFLPSECTSPVIGAGIKLSAHSTSLYNHVSKLDGLDHIFV